MTTIPNQTPRKQAGRPPGSKNKPGPVARPEPEIYAPGSVLQVSDESTKFGGAVVVVDRYLKDLKSYRIYRQGDDPGRTGFVHRNHIARVVSAAVAAPEPERKVMMRVAATPPEETEMKRTQEAEQRRRERADIERCLAEKAEAAKSAIDPAALQLERYIVRPTAPSPEPTPAVNFCKASLSINPAAMDALGYPPRVALYFDRARRVMAIAPAAEGEPDTVVVNRYHGNRKSGASRTPSGGITMHGFYARFGIAPYTTPRRAAATAHDGKLYAALPEVKE